MDQLSGLLKEAEEIRAWTKSAPEPSSFRNNNEFMQYTVELMNRTLYLLRVGPQLAPTQDVALKGFTKRRAIVVGHMVRIAKLYEGSLMHICAKQLELAAVFNRLIIETAVRVEYLIKAKRSSFRSFVLTSYKPEKEILAHLKAEAAQRQLAQYERRIRRKIKSRMRRDGISEVELMGTRNWRLDGKDFRRILEDTKRDVPYSYAFGSQSHFVHGDWAELSVYHLTKHNGYYKPHLDYDEPDPRLACAVTTVCLSTLFHFLKWNKSDKDDYLRPIILGLLELNRHIDLAHEDTLGP